jgi:hypothetical protein
VWDLHESVPCGLSTNQFYHPPNGCRRKGVLG